MDNIVQKSATTFTISTEAHDVNNVSRFEISWVAGDETGQASTDVTNEKWAVFSNKAEGQLDILLISTVLEATEEYLSAIFRDDKAPITSKSDGKQWMLDCDQALRDNSDDLVQKVGVSALRASITETGFAGAIVGEIKGLSVSERGNEEFYPTRKPKLAQGCYPVGFNFPMVDNDMIIVGTHDFWNVITNEQATDIVKKARGTDQAAASLLAVFSHNSSKGTAPRALLCLSRTTTLGK